MSSLPVSLFLRRALIADAAASGASSLLLLFGADFLKGLMGLPAALLFYAGLSLIPFTLFLVYLSTRPRVAPRVIWAVIGCNALWTIDSLLLLSGWVRPTVLGSALVVAQASAVAAFAVLEYIGLRRSEEFASSLRRES